MRVTAATSSPARSTGAVKNAASCSVKSPVTNSKAARQTPPTHATYLLRGLGGLGATFSLKAATTTVTSPIPPPRVAANNHCGPPLCQQPLTGRPDGFSRATSVGGLHWPSVADIRR